MDALADIGVFGGSGFTSFLDDVTEVEIETPWGRPSGPLAIGSVGGRRVAFLPRHGRHHHLPPHAIDYRANVDAMRRAGVGALFGPCASGSLRPEVAPGHFVVPDQFVDRTTGRSDTFWEPSRFPGGSAPTDPGVPGHIGLADPYDADLRRIAIDACHAEGVHVHETGTVVVVQGPRFSTRAESVWFREQGWSVVNMTQYPEATLAAEAGLPYVSIALITDYDAGLEHDPDVAAVTQDEVFGFFRRNVETVRTVLFRAIAEVPEHLLARTRARVAEVGPIPPGT